MPNREKSIFMMAALLAVGVLGSTSLYAEHPRATPQSTVPPADGPRIRNTDLTGGFYDDRYKRDNWYYDYYDSPGATRTSSLTGDSYGSGRHADMTDAAHPRTLTRSSGHDHTIAYQQYYDEPWFYNQRDPAYGIPMARPGDPAGEHPSRQENVVKGTVNAVKQVRNRTTGEQNTVALIKTSDNRSVIADLGSTRSTLDMALSKGDNIQVGGQWEDIGDYSVLMAQHVKSGVNRVSLHRGGSALSSESRRVEGRIQQFRDIRVKRTGDMHRTAAVQTADGRFAIVDLGPQSSEPALTNASAGDRLVADGPVVNVGNYPVLLANQVSVNDGAPIRISRPAASMEPTPPSGMTTDPSCVGGGCSSQSSTSHGQSRDPHSNAMDGTIR